MDSSYGPDTTEYEKAANFNASDYVAQVLKLSEQMAARASFGAASVRYDARVGPFAEAVIELNLLESIAENEGLPTVDEISSAKNTIQQKIDSIPQLSAGIDGNISLSIANHLPRPRITQ